MSKKTNEDSKNKKKKQSKILISLIVIIVFIYALYKLIKLIINPTDMVMVEEGTIYDEEAVVGYIIREEETVEGSNTKNGIIQIKSEGEKVAKGSQIFRYATTNEDEINSKIEELDEEIQEALLGQTDLFSSDINAIDSQIESKIDGLSSKNNLQEISEYKQDINTYITKKAKIAGELSAAGSYIKQLIEQRETYQNELKNNSEYVTAPISGVVSYRVDGLEDILTPDDFDSLSKEMLEGLDLQTGQIVTTSNEKGKVINNYECYIATLLDSTEAEEATINQKVSLRLSTQDEISATISYISEQDDESILIIFNIKNDVEDLIGYRKISFDIIWWQYDGLKVPKSAIYYDNGLSYVVRSRAGYQDKILVEILKENENYCIVGSYDNDELRSLGYTTEEINSMKKISIYDEIIVNPEAK